MEERLESIRAKKPVILLVIFIVTAVALLANGVFQLPQNVTSAVENVVGNLPSLTNSDDDFPGADQPVQEPTVKSGTPIELSQPRSEVAKPVQIRVEPRSDQPVVTSGFVGVYKGEQNTYKACSVRSLGKSISCSSSCVSRIAWSGAIPGKVTVKTGTCVPPQ